MNGTVIASLRYKWLILQNRSTIVAQRKRETLFGIFNVQAGGGWSLVAALELGTVRGHMAAGRAGMEGRADA